MTLINRYWLQNLELVNVITNTKRQLTLPLVTRDINHCDKENVYGNGKHISHNVYKPTNSPIRLILGLDM